MLSEYNVNQSFWAEDINTACYCSNRLYCHPLKEKTPYELLNGRKPNIAYFWILVANATFWGKALDWASLTRNLMKPRVPKMKIRILMMLEAFNFQMPWRTWMLVNWGLDKWMMMKMTKCKCSLTQMCKIDTNQASTSGSHDNKQDQMASTSSQPNDQAVQAIKFLFSNQPILQEIIYWTL